MLYSKNRMWYLTVRSTGELAICLADHSQAWTNAKNGYSRRGDPPYRLVIQQDANLVVYDGGNKAVWSSKTGDARRGQTSFVAVMQDDRNFVIYDDNQGVVWASHSHY